MFTRGRTSLGLLLALAVIFGLLAPTALAAPAAIPPSQGDELSVGRSDDLKHPLGEKQRALRQKALVARIQGVAGGRVHEVSKGKYVELARENTDKIFVVIAEFGTTRHASFPDTEAGCLPTPAACFPGDGSPLTFEGPLHNSIPKPDRKVDNSTLWQKDFNSAHYTDMYFNRMAKYYQSQSSGRYSVEGAVTEWVKVPFNEARYGRDFCGSIVCNNTWFLIRDALAFWVQDQLAAGQTLPEITEYLQTFDEWDRYDYDEDGNFDEPDGYIDHFQIVHAGGDQAAGDPQQGTDAIWSHRWYAGINPSGTGPAGLAQFGGVEAGQGGVSSGQTIPTNLTGVWVGDYTIQPENGGLGVFAHEFGHDLGLPDLYDTSGNTGGAENSTAFWTLMSSGANIGDGGRKGIGDAPTDMGAWEKFQLGWLGCDACPGGKFYDVAFAGQSSNHKLGPANGATKNAQALIVVLPEKRRENTVTAPKTGSFLYYSTMGDEIETSMSKPYTLPAGASLTADVWYDIEEQFDFAFVEVSSDNGATWDPVLTNLSSPASEDQSGFNSSGTGITGSSEGAYVQLTADLSAFTGAVLLRFRYQTDPAVTGQGFVIDNIAVTGSALDGAEDPNAGWIFDGFIRSTGTEITFHFNAYMAENRGYRGYDKSLKTAYNFGFLNTKPDWVEHYPYQDGLLISYWDESFGDNSVGDHPGGGLILPIDAHPKPLHWSDGQLMRQRIQSYDSTFGLDRTDAITLHKDSVPTKIKSQSAVSTFDDLKTWWFASDNHSPESHGRFQVGWTGVNVPRTGTKIRVRDIDSNGFIIEVEVRPSR